MVRCALGGHALVVLDLQRTAAQALRYTHRALEVFVVCCSLEGDTLAALDL